MSIDQMVPQGSTGTGGPQPSLQMILASRGQKFVRLAYLAILGREPDPDGMKSYLGRIRDGERKLQIIKELSMSEEAERKGFTLPGLSHLLALHRRAAIPVIGRVLAKHFFLEGDSEADKRGRALEEKIAALSEAAAEMLRQAAEISQRQQTLDQRQQTFDQRQQTLDQRQQTFEKQQFPTLLQAVSDVNKRQLATDANSENLVKSVPVALRKFTQDVKGLEMAIAHRMTEMSAHVERVITQSEERLEEHFRTVESVSKNSAQITNETKSHLDGALHNIAYLLGRVEFVRREIMYEMRFGATPSGGTGEKLKVEPSIVSPEKLAVARKSGIRLNLGCGHVALPEFINVDRRALQGVDIIAEVDELPIESAEVVEIFSSHLIEHFPQEQLRRQLLGYWGGLLVPGGTFRAVVPDAIGMLNAFIEGACSFEQLRQVTYGGQDYDGDFHFNMLTTNSFAKLLEEAGFVDIQVIAQDRPNGDCREFEIAARRKGK